MKLLLFILGISLCAALPSFRFLQNVEIDASDLVEIPGAPEDELPVWLFEQMFPSEEEDLGAGNEEEDISSPEQPSNGEEALPEEEDYLPGIIVDDVANQAFESGVETVISQGIQKSKIPNTKFTVTKVPAYTKSSTSKGELYTFTCEAVSQNGASVITMNLTVYYDSKTQKTTVRSSSYTIQTTSVKPTNPTNDTYVELEAPELNNDTEVQDVFTYGVDQVIQRGNENGKIPVSEYEVTHIISAARMKKTGRNYYKFNVELQDDNQVLVKAQFGVSIDLATKEKFLTSWSYQVSNVKFSIDESAYTELNKTEAETNAQIKGCLDFAIKEAVKQPEQYTTTKVNAVSTQTVRSTVYYKFNVQLNNGKGKTVQLIATVAYKPETGAMDVKAYETRTSTPRK